MQNLQLLVSTTFVFGKMSKIRSGLTTRTGPVLHVPQAVTYRLYTKGSAKKSTLREYHHHLTWPQKKHASGWRIRGFLGSVQDVYLYDVQWCLDNFGLCSTNGLWKMHCHTQNESPSSTNLHQPTFVAGCPLPRVCHGSHEEMTGAMGE